MVVLGYISSFCMVMYTYPQARKVIRDGHAEGLDGLFLTLWFLGVFTGLLYAVGLGSKPLSVNYGINLLLLLPIIWIKVYPKKADKSYKSEEEVDEYFFGR